MRWWHVFRRNLFLDVTPSTGMPINFTANGLWLWDIDGKPFACSVLSHFSYLLAWIAMFRSRCEYVPKISLCLKRSSVHRRTEKKTWFSLSTKQSRVLESTNHVRKHTTSHKFSDLLTSEKHFLPVSGRCLLWLRFSTRASKKNRPTKEPHSLLRWESKLPHQSPYITATSGLDLSAGKMSVGRVLLRDFSSLIWWGERVGMVWTCVHLFINYTLTLHRVCVYIMLLLSSYFFLFALCCAEPYLRENIVALWRRKVRLKGEGGGGKYLSRLLTNEDRCRRDVCG